MLILPPSWVLAADLQLLQAVDARSPTSSPHGVELPSQEDDDCCIMLLGETASATVRLNHAHSAALLGACT